MKKKRKTKARTKARKVRTRNEVARQAFSVSEFSAAHGISNAMFYKLLREGQGPVTMQVGKHLRVSIEAAERWRRQRESAPAKEKAPPD
jgi:predicted DNA-binding transcriptional regulator AlpA